MPQNSENLSPEKLPLPQAQPAVTQFLKRRRSNLAKLMQEPGPSPAQLAEILEIGARVPDHRKLTPWRFITFQGKARSDFGVHLARAFQLENPNMPIDRALFEGQRLTRAPLVIAVISSPKDCPRGTPKWEQTLSVGAACLNLCLAAQSHGFGAQWLTEWYAYNPLIDDALGLTAAESVAGYIYIGRVDEGPTERARPDMTSIIREWGA